MENAFVGNCSEAFWNLGLTNLVLSDVDDADSWLQ